MNIDDLIAQFRALIGREGETLGRLLASAERVVLQETLAELKELGHEVRPAQLQVIQQICLSGGRVSAVVSKLHMSKQAVGQIVDGLERAGWVRRLPDPSDARARRIEYTPEGCRLVADIIAVTERVELRWKARIGPKDFRNLKKTLTALTEPSAPEDRRA